MARQRVHNRRAGSGTGNAGSSWISYSDMMAALVLVFVLFLTYNLYQYNTILQQKTDELEEQKGKLDVLQIQLDEQEKKLDEQEGILIIKQAELDKSNEELQLAQGELKKSQDELKAAQDELNRNIIILIGQQQELEDARAKLAARETELSNLKLELDTKETALRASQDLLEAQKKAFADQTARISSMVGVRGEIIEELSAALRQNNIRASVDASGNIVLESTVFFESGKSDIKAQGKALLNQFVPVYLNVLLKPEYRDFLDEIIIEGHTDSTGTFVNNMTLSSKRALTVLEYCLTIPGLTYDQQQLLQSKLSALGRSSSELIYNPDGTENKDASRRVEFKFRLKDSEMVEEMRQILETTTLPLP